MVAISLYKGNLHRAPDTPRQWLMPPRKISLKDFKTLIHRRSKALARLQSTSNPNPNPNSDPYHQSNGSLDVIVNDSSLLNLNNEGDDELPNSIGDENCKKGSTSSNGDDNNLVIPSGELVARELADSNALLHASLQMEDKEDQLVIPKDDALVDKEERKKEVEEKLQVLNERKHKLVQVLKQILHAEEELRRRSNAHGVTGRPSVSLQVDVTNDYGSLSRHVTPRPGSEVADMEGADAYDVSNQMMHSRNMTRMSIMSPTSDSLHRRGPFSMVPNPSQGVVACSPSRFGPSCNGEQQGNMPTVSVTGTNYVASSPSPAGSGGTSVLRDARLPSPWN